MISCLQQSILCYGYVKRQFLVYRYLRTSFSSVQIQFIVPPHIIRCIKERHSRSLFYIPSHPLASDMFFMGSRIVGSWCKPRHYLTPSREETSFSYLLWSVFQSSYYSVTCYKFLTSVYSFHVLLYTPLFWLLAGAHQVVLHVEVSESHAGVSASLSMSSSLSLDTRVFK